MCSHVWQSTSIVNTFKSYVFLRKVDDILQIWVSSVIVNYFINKSSELVLKPVLVNKAQNSGNKLSEENDAQADRKLKLIQVASKTKPQKALFYTILQNTNEF